MVLALILVILPLILLVFFEIYNIEYNIANSHEIRSLISIRHLQ
ncbi:conserved protein of unknown function [Limnospira indica PCC 8005]|uniref:Uncharacterized protein n=1 Tax=Limnospira indica PCC 8005 TaxID=376219 RepID=A0A9P1KH58_9CYAN|nr:conserved protein of unknown function [Limnospira indica PCC 8005]